MKLIGLVALLSVINRERANESLAQRKRRLWRAKLIGWAMANQKPFEVRIFLASINAGGQEERRALERMDLVMKADNERRSKKIINEMLHG